MITKRSACLVFSGILSILVLTLPVPVEAEEGVTIGFGTMKIGGIYQSLFTWYEDDDVASQFKTLRARLILSGTLVPDKVKYFVQADAVQTPYLLDTKLLLYVIPKTEIAIGRMIPYFTLYMPAGTNKLDFVNYPMTTSRFAMWRQTGVQFKSTFDNLSIFYGVFNGYDTDAGSVALKGNDWGDKNDAKDFLLSADYKLADGMKIGAFAWWGKPYDSINDDDFDVSRYGANFNWLTSQFHIAAEYISGTTEYVGGYDVKSNAWMAQGSVFLGDAWELLARYEMYDPNTDVDDDGESWLTAGINYSLASINTKFFLNYIAKMEEGKDTSIDNDEIVIQAQYSF